MGTKYKKLSQYAEENAVTYRTALNRFNAGKIQGSFKDDTGHIKIPVTTVDISKGNKAAVYARVSSNDRRASLDNQLTKITDYAISNGYQIEYSIKEVASGMNDNRKKLIKLFNNDDWDILIVENKDRLTRFGFNYIETLLNNLGKEIIVINKSNDDKEDVMKDLISIIYSFSARMYGLRRRKKKQEIINFLES